MKSQEEIELKLRDSEKVPNFPGYSARLEFRALRKTDGLLLAPVFKTSAKSIRTYLSDYQNAQHWWLKDTQEFVRACVSDDFPTQHFLFTIGGRPVALGSFHSYANQLNEVQIVLAVFGTNQGKGVGSSVAETLKTIAFDVWGFDRVWWIVDATNRASMRLADKIGCTWDSTFEDEKKYGELGSGLWHRYVVDRDPNSIDGILQGASIDYWSLPKSPGMLKAVLGARNKPQSSRSI
jgi:RimJ/RimL family protein N-acetyltransferase